MWSDASRAQSPISDRSRYRPGLRGGLGARRCSRYKSTAWATATAAARLAWTTMMHGRLKQFGLIACALGAIGLSAYASQRVWWENGLKSLQAVSEQRVQLVANAIKAEISRQD